MSEFLKFAFEVLSQVVYNFAGLLAAALKLFITGWWDYFTIFFTYFRTLNVFGKILSVLLMLVLVAIPVIAIVLIARHVVLPRRLPRAAAGPAAPQPSRRQDPCPGRAGLGGGGGRRCPRPRGSQAPRPRSRPGAPKLLGSSAPPRRCGPPRTPRPPRKGSGAARRTRTAPASGSPGL